MKIFENISFRDVFMFVLFALLTFYIPFNEFGCTRNQMIGLGLIAISLLSSMHCNAMQIAFFLPYVAATAYPLFGIPLHISTLIELIFVCKIVLRYGFPSNGKSVMLIGVFLQFVPFVVFEQDPMNVVRFLCNIALFCGYFQLLKFNNKSTNFIAFSFALGVLTSCVAGFYYVRPITEEAYDIEISWLRYCGLWTDPNFLGGFCLISICYLLTLTKSKLLYRIITYGMCIALFYYGTLTLSRTFLVVAATVVVFYIMFVQSKGFTFKKGLASIVIAGLSVVFLSNYIGVIESNRVVGSEGATGGRADATSALIEAQMDDPVAMLFGVGYDNTTYTMSLNSIATHNSYVDIMLQFGFIGLVIIMALLLRYKSQIVEYFRFMRTPSGVPMICLLLYLATLSALKYEFVYVVAALFFSEYKSRQLCIKS